MRTTTALWGFVFVLGATAISAFAQTAPPDSTPDDAAMQNARPGGDETPPDPESLDGPPQTAPDSSSPTSASRFGDAPGWTTKWGDDGRLRVVGVEPNSLAADLGLQVGDEILAVNGREVGPGENVDQLLAVHTNQRLSMLVLRDGERRMIHVFPEPGRQPVAMRALRRGPPVDMGVLLDGQEAVFITGVYRGSPAEQAGLLPGDELISVNGRRYYTSADFSRALRQFAAGDRVRIQVVRNNQVRDVPVTLVDWAAAFNPREIRLADPDLRRSLATESRAYRPPAARPGPSHDGAASALREMRQQLDALRTEVNALRAEIAVLRQQIAAGRGPRLR